MIRTEIDAPFHEENEITSIGSIGFGYYQTQWFLTYENRTIFYPSSTPIHTMMYRAAKSNNHHHYGFSMSIFSHLRKLVITIKNSECSAKQVLI